MGRNHIRVPKNLSAYQNYPGGDNLTRVHHFDNIRRVALAGYNDYRQVAGIAESYGVDLSTSAVLDWGSGHGRMIRHFADEGRVKEAWAVDIDPENIAWLNDNIDSVEASTVPLLPPTDLPEKHFDLIYAISVMTHLTYDVQEAWLKELKRITKPGGIVMLTFAGRTSVSFASQFLTPEWLESWERVRLRRDARQPRPQRQDRRRRVLPQHQAVAGVHRGVLGQALRGASAIHQTHVRLPGHRDPAGLIEQIGQPRPAARTSSSARSAPRR